MIRLRLLPLVLLAGLSGCGPSYSPDTYATNAAQQANKAEQGVVVGVRKVAISASGTVGAVTGGAAGGIAGAQVGIGSVSAFSALGGSLVGGLAGSAVEHATADTDAFEYIVRKPNNELVSITQRDKVPLAIGEKVLVIGGAQARVVPDYTVTVTDKPAEAVKPDAVKAAPTQGDPKPSADQPAMAAPTPLSPAPQPGAAAAGSTQAAPTIPPAAHDASKAPAEDTGAVKSATPAPESRPAAAS